MMSSPKPPHLIIIGAQKSGTTWLQHVLDCDDQFFCPAVRQEVSFFTNYWEKGMDYYTSLYAKARPDQITVDVSPRYQEVDTSPQRIADFQKKTDRPVKLILICREPVSRLKSAYQMYIKQGYQFDNLQHAIQKTPDLIEKGLYYKTLEKYKAHFDENDIFVLFFDDLRAHNEKLLGQIKNFFHLKNTIVNAYEDIKINSGGKPRFPIISETIRYSGRTLRALGLTKLIHKIKKTSVVQKVQGANEVPFTLSETDQQFLQTLRPTFQEDVTKLQGVLDNRNLLEEWKYQ